MKKPAEPRTSPPEFALTASDVKYFFAETPLLNPAYHLSFDLDEIIRDAKTPVPEGTYISDFDEFKKIELSKTSALQEWMANVGAAHTIGEPPPASANELWCFVRFLKQLPSAQLTAVHISIILHIFCEYAGLEIADRPDVAELHSAVTALLVGTFRCIDLHKEPNELFCRNDNRNDLVEAFEGLLEKLITLIGKQHSVISEAKLIESLNITIFAYSSFCSMLGVGLRSTTFNELLLVKRRLPTSTWLAFGANLRLQYSVICLSVCLVFFPLDKPFETRLGISINSLSNLRVVLADAVDVASNASHLLHLYVFRWILDKLDAEVFSILGINGRRLRIPALTPGEQGAVVELSRQFSFYRYPITAEHLELFLLQFESTARIRGMIRLLTHIRYFPMWQLSEAIESILQKEIEREQRVVIAPFGDRTGSTAIIGYLLSHSKIGDNVQFVDTLTEAINITNHGDRIYFIDDCVMSGTQTLNIVGDILGTRRRKPHHTQHANPLSNDEKKKLLGRTIVFSFVVACDNAITRLEHDLIDTGLQTFTILPAIVEPVAFKAFEPLSPVAWMSKEEREELKGFCTEVGYDILSARAKRKKWSDERRYESALGFSDYQKLFVFPYGVPKTTLTLLWECGTGEKAWVPLFPGVS